MLYRGNFTGAGKIWWFMTGELAEKKNVASIPASVCCSCPVLMHSLSDRLTRSCKGEKAHSGNLPEIRTLGDGLHDSCFICDF